jgi:hypothetical protein
MKRNRIAWMVGTKVALTLALTVPLDWRGPPEYWALAPFPGLEPGALVTLGGVLVGRVTSKTERGDTTFLGVRFSRGVDRLPGSRVVRLQRLGPNGEVALEIRPDRQGGTRSFARGGFVRVLPADPPFPSEWPLMAAPRGLLEPPQILQLLPPAPPHRRTSLTAT